MSRRPLAALVATALSLTVAISSVAAAHPTQYVATLSGAQEVPARATPARGTAVFQLSADGTELTYRLIVANIHNVVAAHIHLGTADVNGPVVAFLYGNQPPGGGRSDGVLATGTITAADLTGNLDGRPLSELIDAMASGGAYVNVHTNDGVAPTNTGPGDFPGGEIRGQIDHPKGRLH